MASTVLDDIQWKLKCPTCLEIFNNPVTLECGHSFCVKCLNDYVLTHPTAVTRKILHCSVCRHETKVPHPEEPVKDWAKQLELSFTIRKLTDQIKNSSTSNSDNHCVKCRGYEETTPAVWWCQECDISLCQRCSRTHQLTPVSEGHNLIGVMEKSKISKPFKALCPEHKELITFHCKECKHSVCSSCCTLQHRKCYDIVPIQSVLGEMESSITESHKTVLERLQDKEIELTTLKSQLEFVESKQYATLSKIGDEEERMMTLLQEKYKQDKYEVMEAVEEETSALQAAIKTAQLDIQMYHQHAAVLSQVMKSRDKTDILSTYEFCQSGSLLAEDARDRSERDHVTDLYFRVCENNVKCLLSQLGQVEVTEGMLYRPKLMKRVCTGTEADKFAPRLWDIISLEVEDVDCFIVTDADNYNVKCFYTADTYHRTSHSVCQLEDEPKGITKFRDNSVMVAVPRMYQLVTLCVAPNLVKKEIIETEKGYSSLCWLNNGLVAAGRQGSVDLLSVSRNRVTTVRCLAGPSETSFPDYLTGNLHNGNIIISDSYEHTVTSLTSGGDFKWTDALSWMSFTPRGVTTTRRGDVVVVDGHFNNIVVLTRSGVYKADILTSANSGIHLPQSVHCDDQGYLYVTNRFGMVSIYKLMEI